MSNTIIDVSDLLIKLGKSDTATDAERAVAELIIPLADAAVKDELGYQVNQATHTHFLPDENMYGQQTDYVDVIQGRINIDGWSGTQILVLPEIPVRSITAIYSDMAAFGGQGVNDFPAASLIVQGVDYYLDNITDGCSWTGFVRRYYNNWPARARAVKAVYVAGFTDAELDGNGSVGRKRPGQIKAAALIAAAMEFHRAEVDAAGGTGAITSEKLGDYAVGYSDVVARYMSNLVPMSLPPASLVLLQKFKRIRR